MLFSKILFLEPTFSFYEESVRIIGKDFTDRIRLFFITPIKVLTNQQSLKIINNVLTYYTHSSMKGLTAYELINQSLFSSAFAPSKRLAILSFQYEFLYQRLTSLQRDEMRNTGTTVWTRGFENSSHAIVLKIAQKLEYEGCLSLSYCFDKLEIYNISFTICSGKDLGFADKFVILISKIQGVKGMHENIVKATKQLIDVFPAAALMAALEGFALSLEITKIICIAAKNQVSIKTKDQAKAATHYDDFWKTFEAERVKNSGDYLLSIPFVFKSEKLIRSKFRKRTLAKRTLRKDISKIIQTSCQLIFSTH